MNKAGLLVQALAVLFASSASAWAQLAESDNRAEIQAEVAWRVLRERRVYDMTGRWIGRVEAVRARRADGQLVAGLVLRPRYLARRFAIPVSLFVDRAGQLVVSETLEAIRASPASPAK